MSLSKSKFWYSNCYLHFSKCAVPFAFLSKENKNLLKQQQKALNMKNDLPI